MIMRTITNEKIVGIDENDHAEKEVLTELLQSEFRDDVGVEFRGHYQLHVEVESTAENIAAVDSAVAAWEAED